MIMTNFLQKRRSVREFKNTPISLDNLEEIKRIMKELSSEKEELDFLLLENGKIIYKGLDGKAGYSGVMIKSPQYIALQMDNMEERTLLEAGYYLEKLQTKLVYMDIDTCWITVDKVDSQIMKSIFGETGDKIKFLLAIGYGKGKKLFAPEVTSGRHELDQIVSIGSLGADLEVEELENRGLLDIFASVRYAPSHKNFQPWRFVVDGPSVYVYMVKSSENNRSFVDIGLVMFYFEEMAKTVGKNGKWEVILEDGQEYVKVAKFTM